MAAHDAATLDPRDRATCCATASTSSRTSPTSSTIRRTATSSSSAIAACVFGGRVSHRRRVELVGRPVEHTVGAQLRNDDIPTSGSTRPPRARGCRRSATDDVWQTSVGVFAQIEMRLEPSRARDGRAARRPLSLRRRRRATRATPARERDGLVSPKGGLVLGPWAKTEFYVNAGTGFHSNDARGATITRRSGRRASRPIASRRWCARAAPRSACARSRFRTCRSTVARAGGSTSTPSCCSSATPARPRRAGRAGATASSGRTSSSRGAGSRSTPTSRSRARVSRDDDPAGARIPGAVGAVVSAGATVDGRWPLFGQPALALLRRRARSSKTTASARRRRASSTREVG